MPDQGVYTAIVLSAMLELGSCPDKYREYFFFQEKKYRRKIIT
jgi:hypothetical protein